MWWAPAQTLFYSYKRWLHILLALQITRKHQKSDKTLFLATMYRSHRKMTKVPFLSISILLELYLPPLQTPLGSVTHPQPCPHGKAQVNDPRGLSSWWDFRSTATAALPRTSAAAWLTLSLCDLRADTSELVGAVGVIERDKGRLVWVSGNVKSNFIVITVRGTLSFCSGVSYRESIVKVDRSAKGQPEFRISNL